MSKMKISLTKNQFELICWSLNVAIDQHQKFLRHDDWDFGMTKKDRYQAMKTDRDLIKARQIFEKAYITKGKD